MAQQNELMTKREAMTGMTPKTFGEAMEYAKIVSNSALVPSAYRGKPADILVAIQLGDSVGLPAIQALQYIAVINGRPSIYGDAALAIVRSSPVCVDVCETFDAETMAATCVAQRQGARPVTWTFSEVDAKKAGLWGKQGPWSAYPKRMLQMRARGFALRDAFPDVLLGLSIAEEAQDIPSEATDFGAEASSGTGSWRKPNVAATAAIDAEFMTVETEKK